MTLGNRRVRAGAINHTLRAPKSSARAVTLLELLVALGVIALLLAILLPTLAGARRTAQESIDVANLRSTHQQFYEWGAAHDDNFLNAGPPLPGKEFFIQYGGCTIVGGDYFGQTSDWPLVLGDWTGVGSPAWHSSHAPRPAPRIATCRVDLIEFVVPSRFYYSRSMLASPEIWTPELWNGDCFPADFERYFRYVRWSEARYPAEKGLLFDSASPMRDDGSHPAAVAFVDGSAAMMDLMQSVAVPEGPCDFQPVLRTPRGILGRDFQR